MPVQGVMGGDGLVGSAANALAPNFLRIVADFGSPVWNTVGDHAVLHVQGIVRMRAWSSVIETLASPTNRTVLGLCTENSGMVFNQVALSDNPGSAGALWSTGDAMFMDIAGTERCIADMIVSNQLIVLQVITEALTAGKLHISCVWEPMTPGAQVTAGDGSAPS